MSEEELYKLALSDVPNYSLLNEIFAIRDKRFPNEENDYTIKVYGSISLDVLNKYVKVVQENSQIKEKIEKAQKLIEVPTYPENIYLGFCYLFGKYNYDELPSKIKEALK